MKKLSYILLVSFAAKLTRQNLAAIAPRINASVRKALTDCEAILTGDTCVVFVGTTQSDAPALFKSVAADLRIGDHLTVIELGEDLMTSLPSLLGWHVRRQTSLGGAPRT